MEDEELAAIRAARLAQLQQDASAASHQRSPATVSGIPGKQGSSDDQTKRREEEMMRDMLATVLEPAARERRPSLLSHSLPR